MLVIFDIDGTLTRTVDLDTEAYATAFRGTFRADLPSLDWASYRNATESGVAEEAATAVLGRPPVQAELVAMQGEFLVLLREALAELPPAELEMPGAAALLRILVGRDHLCTGPDASRETGRKFAPCPQGRYLLPKGLEALD